MHKKKSYGPRTAVPLCHHSWTTKNKRFHDFANDFPSLLKKNSNPNLDEDGTLWRRPSFKIET